MPCLCAAGGLVDAPAPSLPLRPPLSTHPQHSQPPKLPQPRCRLRSPTPSSLRLPAPRWACLRSSACTWGTTEGTTCMGRATAAASPGCGARTFLILRKWSAAWPPTTTSIPCPVCEQHASAHSQPWGMWPAAAADPVHPSSHPSHTSAHPTSTQFCLWCTLRLSLSASPCCPAPRSMLPSQLTLSSTAACRVAPSFLPPTTTMPLARTHPAAPLCFF